MCMHPHSTLRTFAVIVVVVIVLNLAVAATRHCSRHQQACIISKKWVMFVTWESEGRAIFGAHESCTSVQL